ncbi:MAG: rhomboid family intramembrane serine protease [Bacteroidia bacterium]|nr:rhomboid family intramembrane serine protease [Bacteroidia bacterium]
MSNRLWQRFTEDKVAMLVYINIAVFVFVRLMDFISLVGLMPNMWVLDFLEIPSSDIVITLLTRPWTIVTYMFTHYDFVHIIFNLIALYWFGKLMSALVGEHLILRTYLIGGIAGAIAYFIAPLALVPLHSHMLGASAAVMAIILCVSVMYPRYTIRLVLIGEVKLGWVAAAYVLIDILSIPGLSNVGGHIAHLGGAVAGIILALIWKNRGIPTSGLSKWFRRRHLKIVRGGMADADMEWNRKKVERIAEIDRILDKIKASGYDSLTEEERQALLNESKR